MTETLTPRIEEDTDQSAARFIMRELIEFNRLFASDDNFARLVITLRDGANQIVGGLVGETYWDWLHVDILWVSEVARGQGYGTQLLEMAEQEARQRGCHSVHLDTLSFQALPFYQKNGYTIFGILENHPIGHTRYYLQKKLVH